VITVIPGHAEGISPEPTIKRNDAEGQHQTWVPGLALGDPGMT